MTTSLLYVCLDGLGDDPIPAFDGRTPLEAADTPNLDALATRGRTGTVLTVGPGIAPESDIGVFGILGYDPHEEHPGRGVLEVLGIGMDFRDGDLAYRVNFATADGSAIVDRRVGRDLSSDEAAQLADEVNRTLVLPGASFELRATVEHRGALVLRTDDGAPLSAEVTNTDPAYRREGNLGVALETFEPRVITAEALTDSETARRAAALTNAFVEGSAAVLEASAVNAERRAEGKLPANQILTRDAGDRRPTLQPIRERFGLSWGCFVEMPVERGIALALGMEPVDAPRLDPAGFGLPPALPTRHGRSSPRTRSAGSRLSTFISRGPTSPPMTAASKTSATSSRRSTGRSSGSCSRGSTRRAPSSPSPRITPPHA